MAEEGVDSVHLNCFAHSGLATKLNVNLLFGGFGALILSALLTVAIDIRGSVRSTEIRIAVLEKTAESNVARITSLERQLIELQVQMREKHARP